MISKRISKHSTRTNRKIKKKPIVALSFLDECQRFLSLLLQNVSCDIERLSFHEIDFLIHGVFLVLHGRRFCTVTRETGCRTVEIEVQVLHFAGQMMIDLFFGLCQKAVMGPTQIGGNGARSGANFSVVFFCVEVFSLVSLLMLKKTVWELVRNLKISQIKSINYGRITN